jgi:transcriptional regulator with XRE-family HTH domain
MNLLLEISRLKSGLTKIQLAQRAGLRRDRLSMIVHGWVRPSEDERARIARALGEPEAALFGIGNVDALAAENKPAEARATA